MRKPTQYKEQFLQEQFARWLDNMGYLYCASAGGMRVNMGTAVKMKRSGYKKGFPDIFIYMPKGKYFGLAIELKTDTGRASPEQLEWQRKLNEQGYLMIIQPRGLSYQRGFEWLKQMVESYMFGIEQPVAVEATYQQGSKNTCELCGQDTTLCHC